MKEIWSFIIPPFVMLYMKMENFHLCTVPQAHCTSRPSQRWDPPLNSPAMDPDAQYASTTAIHPLWIQIHIAHTHYA